MPPASSADIARAPATRRTPGCAFAAFAARLTFFALAAGCDERLPDSPRPVAVIPDQGPSGHAVRITISGEGLSPSVTTNFDHRSRSRLNTRFVVRLGRVPLRDVRGAADGALTAEVPESLEEGLYALTVVDSAGRFGELADAYRVVGDDESFNLVSSFRFEPIGPAAASVPFAVAIDALDDDGQVVGSFNGPAALSDLTGTAVPSTVGYFVGGRWKGQVEVRQPHPSDALTATAEGGASGESNTFVVTALPGTALRFSTPPRAVAAGDCSPAVTVEILDALGQTTVAAAPTLVSLAPSQPVGFGLFSDGACTAPLSSPTVAAGDASATVYFRATHVGPVTLFVSTPGLTGASQQESVVAAPAVRLVFQTAPQNVAAGACSQPATVQAEDTWANPSPASVSGTVGLAAVGTAFGFFSDATCASSASSVPLAQGQAKATFYFSSTRAQLADVSASLGSLTPATQTERIDPAGPATQLAYVTPAQTIPTGTCSAAVTLETRDPFGNAVAGTSAVQVALAAAPAAGFTLYGDAACTNAVGSVGIAAASSTASFYFQGQVPRMVSVSASAANLTSALQVETVVPGAGYDAGTCPPDSVTFTADGTFTLPANCTSMTVQAYGGGGAGGAKNQGSSAAAGGAGGQAVKTFTGQAPGTAYQIIIGLGGTCGSKVATPGGYAGGRGGNSGGSINGGNGLGATAPPGGTGGAGSSGGQPGGAGGNGGYGAGGGGGGGDSAPGNSGGAATTFQLASPVTDYVVAGGGGGAGAADQNGDVAGAGGAACDGYDGANGAAAVAGGRSAGGGGGGACFCLGGTCDSTPIPGGGAGGVKGTSGGTCAAAQNGAGGWVVVTVP